MSGADRRDERVAELEMLVGRLEAAVALVKHLTNEADARLMTILRTAH